MERREQIPRKLQHGTSRGSECEICAFLQCPGFSSDPRSVCAGFSLWRKQRAGRQRLLSYESAPSDAGPVVQTVQENEPGRRRPPTPSVLFRLLLIAVRMTVAPIPIVPLHCVVLPVVLTIRPVFCRQVTPVGAVLVVVPIVVITVVPIIDSHLDAAFLRSRMSHDCGWCSNGSSQE
jgi:hypothetical protein